MVILNVILLNVLWLASVLGAANKLLWPAVLCLILLLAVTYIYEGLNKTDRTLIIFSLVFGTVLDGLLQASGLLIYASPFHPFSWLPPLWIMFLWIGFAASIKVGMRWLVVNPVVGTLIMSIGAPISYYSASKIGGVELVHPFHAMLAIALGWFIYFICVTQFFYDKQEQKNVWA